MNATTRWEYKVIGIKPANVLKFLPEPEQIEERLNPLGRDGWELVSVIGGSGVISLAFCLKRQL